MKTINNYVVKEKNVLMRVDLNVPVLNGIITEKSRIDTIKPTIRKLLNQRNKIFLLSHFRRPEGKFSKKYSLEFICSTLQEELETNRVHFLESFNNSDIKNKIHTMNFGEICLFENIRFHPEEESNDLNFIQEICKNFDVYVNDAFSASHRNHASIVGAPQFLPSLAGESLLDEIRNIDSFFNEPKKPNIAIIGGSKISTKINLLHNLTEFFNTIVIGGAMANTFLNAQNVDIGNSLCEKDLSNTALSIMEKADNFNCKIILPIDAACANNLKDQSSVRYCDIKNILPNQMVFDVGNKTSKLISENIKWNLKITKKKIKALLINTRNANAFTGKNGFKGLKILAEKLSQELTEKQKSDEEKPEKILPDEILFACTGTIGESFPTEQIKQSIPDLIKKNFHQLN